MGRSFMTSSVIKGPRQEARALYVTLRLVERLAMLKFLTGICRSTPHLWLASAI